MNRGRGKRGPQGRTKSEIIRYLFKRGEKSEPDIKIYLRRELDIGNNKTVKDHLRDLKERDVVDKRREKGKPNYWSLKLGSNLLGYILNSDYLELSRFQETEKFREAVHNCVLPDLGEVGLSIEEVGQERDKDDPVKVQEKCLNTITGLCVSPRVMEAVLDLVREGETDVALEPRLGKGVVLQVPQKNIKACEIATGNPIRDFTALLLVLSFIYLSDPSILDKERRKILFKVYSLVEELVEEKSITRFDSWDNVEEKARKMEKLQDMVENLSPEAKDKLPKTLLDKLMGEKKQRHGNKSP